MQTLSGFIGSLFFFRTATSIPLVGPIFWFVVGAAVEASFPGTSATIGTAMLEATNGFVGFVKEVTGF